MTSLSEEVPEQPWQVREERSKVEISEHTKMNMTLKTPTNHICPTYCRKIRDSNIIEIFSCG